MHLYPIAVQVSIEHFVQTKAAALPLSGRLKPGSPELQQQRLATQTQIVRRVQIVPELALRGSTRVEVTLPLVQPQHGLTLPEKSSLHRLNHSPSSPRHRKDRDSCCFRSAHPCSPEVTLHQY